MFAQVGLNKKVNLQYFCKRPDCTVFYCPSLALWVKVGIIALAFVINVVFFGWICWFCRKRIKNKQENQVQTELSEKDKKGILNLEGVVIIPVLLTNVGLQSLACTFKVFSMH